MKSTINHSMKSVFWSAALCGIYALTAATLWTTARGAVEEEPREGGKRVEPRIHQKPAPKPQAVAKREAPRPKENAVKGLPHEGLPHEPKGLAHEGPKTAGFRRPIAIRNLEFVAHLRHELFTHRWSFAYAASLKHAPKSIRFLQNGTVETEIKGERWYWEALDGRRVALRTLADESQPAITLEFDEGYTNFRYVLPDQTVAVQGAPVEAIAEGPAASSPAGGTPASLEQALLTYPWNWNDAGGTSESGVRFKKNKSFRIAGRTSFWNVTGPRTVHVEFENGDQTDLLFDTTFSVYTDGNQISGTRVMADSDVAASDVKQ